MQTIRYIFSDGTTSEIEVTDEFYTLYAELMQQEMRNHWKETRRHISLENLNENGIDFESPAADLLCRTAQGKTCAHIREYRNTVEYERERHATAAAIFQGNHRRRDFRLQSENRYSEQEYKVCNKRTYQRFSAT